MDEKEGLWDKNLSLGLREVGHFEDKVPESTSAATGRRGGGQSLSSSSRACSEFTVPTSVVLKFYRSVSAPAMMLSTHSTSHKHQEKGRAGGRILVSKSQKPRKRKVAKLEDSGGDSLPPISPQSGVSAMADSMDRLSLEIRCEYCGQLTPKKTLACHTKWCVRQRQLRAKPDSASSRIRAIESKASASSRGKSKPEEPAMEASTQGRIVARVVTVGLAPGQCEQVFFHSSDSTSKRPQTRTLRQSFLQSSGYGLPSIDGITKGQDSTSDGQAAGHSSMEQCKTCHKVIASDRVGVHHRLCKSPQMSTGVVQIPSTHNLLRVNSKQPVQTPVQSRAPRKPPTVACYICGREYGSKSLAIHEPQCLKKFNIQNDKLPISERLPLPKKNRASAVARVLLREEDQIVTPSLPEGIYKNIPEEGGGLVQKFFEHCYSEFEKDLVPCRKCGRTFAPERHVKHEPNCNAKPLKML